MDLRLGGKICLVTGASRGIGRGTAKVLATEGCRVAIVARRESLLEELADEIERETGSRPLVVVEDLMSDGAAERVRAHVLEELGGLDVLVNNAGSSRPVKWNATEEQWREGVALNFDNVRRLTNAFIPTMRTQRWGRIINVTGANEPPGVNIASVAKAALHNWAKGLSRELAPDGITVNCLPPGRINSEQILERLHPTPENRRAFIDANIPVGYFGRARGHGLPDRVPRLAARALHHGRSDPRRRRDAPLRGLAQRQNRTRLQRTEDARMRIDAIRIGRDPPHDVNVIIEVPLGGQPIKYELDKEAGTLVVDRFLYTSMAYPGNYGFVPHTLSEDGDPIDVLVCNTRPLVAGCVINVRPIGVLVMEDNAGQDEKIIAVPRHTSRAATRT